MLRPVVYLQFSFLEPVSSCLINVVISLQNAWERVKCCLNLDLYVSHFKCRSLCVILLYIANMMSRHKKIKTASDVTIWSVHKPAFHIKSLLPIVSFIITLDYNDCAIIINNNNNTNNNNNNNDNILLTIIIIITLFQIQFITDLHYITHITYRCLLDSLWIPNLKNCKTQ